MRARALLSFIALVVATPSTSQAPPQPVTALAPFEVVLDGGLELVGVAVTDDGTIYASDRGAGLVYRVAGGHVTVVLDQLARPAGVVVDRWGRLVVVEEAGGRVLRREANGDVTILAAGLKTPRWLATSADGTLYVSAHRLSPPDGADDSEGRQIVRVRTDGRVDVVAAGIRQLEGLVRLGSDLVAATKGLDTSVDSAGMLLRYPIRADGSLGAPVAVLATGVKKPVHLAGDGLATLFVSAKELALLTDPAQRVIGKVHADARLTTFAGNLDDPHGLAFGADGALHLADGRGGRLLRFRPPVAPALTPVPPFTGLSPITLGGTTEADARVDVVVDDGGRAGGLATPAGVFALSVELSPNVDNRIRVYATAWGGDGLTSPGAEATVVHDDRAPGIALVQPSAASAVRGTIGVTAVATDSGSGVASVAFALDGAAVGVVRNPDPGSPLAATISLDTASVADGIHTLRATAVDRAGNVGWTGRSTIVDNTPPDTQITDGPSATVTGGSVTFAFTGSDNLTSSSALVFAWRVDGGTWSPFSAATSTALVVSPGAHAFEVKARDLAGNEDATPATRSFVVGGTLAVAILTPVTGATVSGGLVVVRGTVTAADPDVAVTVNGITAFVAGGTWAAQVPVAAGSTAIVATATGRSGARATASVAVTAAEAAPRVVLRALPDGGVAPLRVTWQTLNETGRSLVALELDEAGTGRFGPPLATLDGVQSTFTSTGLRTPTLRATDDRGQVYIATTLVNVDDAADVTARFRRLWAGFRGELQGGNVQAALGYLGAGLQSRFGLVFQQLGAAVAGIATGLGELHVLEQVEGLAETVVVQDERGVASVYFVYFRRDSRGQWVIEEM